MAGRRSFSVVKGEDFVRHFAWLVNGIPFDLTGYSAEWIFDNDSRVIYTTNDATDSGEVTLGGIAGTIVVAIPASDLTSLDLIFCRYRLLLTNPSGGIRCLLAGPFSLDGARA